MHDPRLLRPQAVVDPVQDGAQRSHERDVVAVAHSPDTHDAIDDSEVLIEILRGKTEERKRRRGRAWNLGMTENADTMKMVVDGEASTERRKGQHDA